jgi:hypothetical protein
MALGDWLKVAPPAEEVLLLIEPDCVFLGPLTGVPVSRGHPVSHPIGYMDPAPQSELVQKHCSRPELVEAAGIPTVLIHRDDLMELVPLWLEKTEDIRNDSRSRELLDGGWISDMWGYTCAAAEMGIRHELRALARGHGEHQADMPIVHYYYPSSSDEHDWYWDKRHYRPWERVPDPPDELPAVDKTLIGLLNEWVSMPEHQICLYGP